MSLIYSTSLNQLQIILKLHLKDSKIIINRANPDLFETLGYCQTSAEIKKLLLATHVSSLKLGIKSDELANFELLLLKGLLYVKLFQSGVSISIIQLIVNEQQVPNTKEKCLSLLKSPMTKFGKFFNLHLKRNPRLETKEIGYSQAIEALTLLDLQIGEPDDYVEGRELKIRLKKTLLTFSYRTLLKMIDCLKNKHSFVQIKGRDTITTTFIIGIKILV